MAFTVDNCAIAYFTMRLLGYGRHGHILQLAAKFDNGKKIDVWIEPSEYVTENASEIDGLEARYGKLFYYNDFLPTVPLEVAMRKILMFLKSSPKPVVIVSHAAQFIFVLFLQAILETDMVDQFESIVVGFSDTLPRFIEKFKDRKGPGKFELETLAHDILEEKYEEKFLEAPHSLEVLERLVNGCSLKASIIEHHKCFEKSLLNEMGAQYSFEIVENLIPLRQIVTLGLVKRFAEAGVTCSSLEEIYRQDEGGEKLKQFLSEKLPNGKPRITESAAVHEKLIAFLQNPPKPRASENVQVDEEMPEINKNIPIYAQIDPFKKRQDRINKEIDNLRKQQSQDYQNVDMLRRPSSGMYATIDPLKKRQDRINKGSIFLGKQQSQDYEDLDSLRRPSSDIYQEIDFSSGSAAVRPPVGRYDSISSGDYQDIDFARGSAAARPPVDRYSRPASGEYEDIDSVQFRGAGARPVDRYSRLSEAIYEDADAYQQPAAEETVELRTKRADPSGSKRRAMYGNLGN